MLTPLPSHPALLLFEVSPNEPACRDLKSSATSIRGEWHMDLQLGSESLGELLYALGSISLV